MANLADILVTLTLDTSEFSKKLKQVGQELNNFQNQVNQITSKMESNVSANLGGVANSLNIVSVASKQASTSMATEMNNMSNSMARTGKSSKYLARTVGTDFEDMYKVLSSASKEYERFASTSYSVSMEVAEQFQFLPKHLQRYVQRLQEAGEATTAFGKLNELYGKRHVEQLKRTNDYLQQQTMTSTKIIQALAEQDIQPLSRQFLKLGERLEDNARKGTALNLAITQLGANASPKQLLDRIKLIEGGIGRARSVLIGMGITTGLMVYGLVLMSNAVDGRLVPAFEKMKSVWTDALTPFVQAFTTFVLWIMNGVTAIGELAKSFAEAHPQLSQMFWGFLALTIALTALLSPLAIGIGLTGGLAASFSALWAIISPFVLGFLTVAGVAVLVAGAIVVVVAVINNLWKASEAFRQAWINIWNNVKETFVAMFVTPVSQAWENLKTAFAGLLASITGGTGTMGNLWTWLGNHLATVINYMGSVLMPILATAFSFLGQAVAFVIQGIATAITWMTQMWQQHKDQIIPILQGIWSAVQTAFLAIVGFISANLPQIKGIVTDVFNVIKAVIDFTMKYIAPVVVGAFKVIWSIIQAVMPAVKQIVVGTWQNIQSVITSAISIIRNTIQLFANVLKGNWKGAWENVKGITKGAVTLVWNLIQLYFLGKILAPIRAFGSASLGLVRSAFNGIKSVITSILNATKAFIVGVWNAIKSSLQGSFTGILNLARTTFNTLKSTVTTIFNSVKSTATTVWNGVKNAITKPIESAKDTVLKIIGQIVKAFSSMKISIPKFKLPKVEVGSKEVFGGKVKIPTFKVVWNAKGNIFNGASILGGGQGVGEAGAEVVMPIQHKRYMKPYASTVASHLSKMMTGNKNQSSGGNQYTIQFNEPVVIREDADIQRIVDELERRRKISERAKGVFSY